MIRNNLRVLEQKVNASDKLSEAGSSISNSISRCYGSLTTFNILFKNKDTSSERAPRAGAASSRGEKVTAAKSDEVFTRMRALFIDQTSQLPFARPDFCIEPPRIFWFSGEN